jgi:hypothetical protein
VPGLIIGVVVLAASAQDNAAGTALLDQAAERCGIRLAHNARQPGPVNLFVTLSTAASDPGHPAHDFFKQRYTNRSARIREGLRQGQRQNQVRSDIKAKHMARLLLAVSDGLRLQWLLAPALAMAEAVQAFNRMSPRVDRRERPGR